MSTTREMNQELFEEWVATRPPEIQDAIRKYPPQFAYRIKDQRAWGYLHSYEESRCKNGHVHVTVKINLTEDTLTPRQVFDVPLEDLRRVEP